MTCRRTTLAMFVMLTLAACGGGDGDGSETTGGTGGTGNTPPPAPESGVFIDSPVAGIHYQTATQSGETDAAGRFNYLPGETVTFSIGGVQLPPVQASDMVTPLMVFETSDITDRRVVNLGRLLQSLDDDGDLENGIQITAEARTAAAGMTLDFDVAPEAFAANTNVVNLLASGGGSPTLVSVDEAIAHMQEQLSSNGLSLVGSWYLRDGDDLITITFLPDGKYIMAEDSAADASGEAGMEYGAYTWDPLTGELTAEALQDTNGEWGLSHPLGDYTIVRDGDSAVFTETNGTTVHDESTWQRVVADAENAIVGTWIVDGEVAGHLSVFVFLPDGDFTLAETGTADDAGRPGIERGEYVWTAATSSFSALVTTNTNGEWGISHDPILTLEVDGDTMNATFDTDAATLTRLE